MVPGRLLPFAQVIPAVLPAEEADVLAVGHRSLYEILSASYLDLHANPHDYSMVDSPDLTFNDGEWYEAGPALRTVVHQALDRAPVLQPQLAEGAL